MRLTDTTARDVPELRADLVTWAADDGPHGYLQQRTAAGAGTGDPAEERRVRDRLVLQLRAAELFFVSSPLGHLAQASGRTLPEYRLNPEDVPAPVGMCVYGDSIGRIGDGDIRLVVWGPGPRGGLEVSFWADAYQFWSDTIVDERTIAQRFGPVAFLHAAHFPWRTVPAWGTVSLTEPDVDIARDATESCERTLISTWLLMGQTLAHSERVLPPRSSRRRIARAGMVDAAVTYTDLRRTRTIPGDNPEASEGRRLTRRSIVRGHWRQQWYPSRGDHRPLWIDPHIRGPEGAPLCGGERVHLLRR
jgi:hypothetical protein